MESHYFWAFFVIALIAGGAITLAVSNATMTGYAWYDVFIKRPPEINGISPAICTDSDGGLDYYVRGTVTTELMNYTDSCDGIYLHEQYCDGDYRAVLNYKCPNGCRDGACISVIGDCSDCQNVLDMLNKCIFIHQDGVNDCNEVCAEGKTCILAFEVSSIDPKKQTPIECGMSKYYNNTKCLCCSP